MDAYIPSTGRQRQEDLKFEATLSYNDPESERDTYFF